MKPTAEDVMRAHGFLARTDLASARGPIDMAFEVASLIAEARAERPEGSRLVAWLREYAVATENKYDAHVLEEAASVLEKLK